MYGVTDYKTISQKEMDTVSKQQVKKKIAFDELPDVDAGQSFEFFGRQL